MVEEIRWQDEEHDVELAYITEIPENDGVEKIETKQFRYISTKELVDEEAYDGPTPPII